ncbi:3'-5' exonuclease [Aliiglaciecola litoralis]|uniref:Exonuclease domain-containing protein n=1 Tax=Aliiglaciecola litoralis TaxID=582857 RepID=A0ABP3WPR0_9ALTE
MQVFDCVLFDTEFTAWQGSKQRNWSLDWEHRELIQIAAIHLRITANQAEIVSSFNELIKPSINVRLSDYISDLTGIEQQLVDDMGVDFESALHQFHQFCSQGQLAALSWGNDAKVLLENCQLYGLEMPVFANGFHNLQRFAQQMQLTGCDLASGELASANGIALTGHLHNALFDVRSLGLTLSHWLKEGHINLAQLLSICKK